MVFEEAKEILGQRDMQPAEAAFELAVRGAFQNIADLKQLMFEELLDNYYHSIKDLDSKSIDAVNKNNMFAPSGLTFCSDTIIRNIYRLIDDARYGIFKTESGNSKLAKVFEQLKSKTAKKYKESKYKDNASSDLYEVACELLELAQNKMPQNKKQERKRQATKTAL